MLRAIVRCEIADLNCSSLDAAFTRQRQPWTAVSELDKTRRCRPVCNKLLARAQSYNQVVSFYVRIVSVCNLKRPV